MIRGMTDDGDPAPAPACPPAADVEPEPAQVHRRELFRGGATLVAGAALAACGTREEPRPAPRADKSGKPVNRRPSSVPQNEGADKAQAGAAHGEALPGGELVELAFADLQARMAAGSESAKSLVAKYRQRIEALDRKGPTLRAVLELNPEADAIADQLDAERKAGTLRGPLHGIPILLKDNIDTGDQMTTTAGSLALEGSRARKDAFVAGRLRAAGAILLGKANLSEWANFRGMASSSGWSARGGQCRNPYALDRTPSGSSSGSAAATAASLCGGSLGSETDGSITSPASALRSRCRV